MKFAIVLNTNLGWEQNQWIHDLSDKLEHSLSGKHYGDDLKALFIAFNCVKPEFEPFFKPKKLRYHKGNKLGFVDGRQYTLEDCIEYEVKLDYAEASITDRASLIKKATELILHSVNKIKGVKGLNEFDFNSFYKDLENAVENAKLYLN